MPRKSRTGTANAVPDVRDFAGLRNHGPGISSIDMKRAGRQKVGTKRPGFTRGVFFARAAAFRRGDYT